MHPFLWIVSFAVGLTLGDLGGLVQAHEHKTGSLRIVHPWVRATPTGAQVAAGFVTIVNTGSASDHLLGGTIAKEARTEAHAILIKGGIARMRPVEGGLEIKPGATLKLAPGGYHLMFSDLKGSLVDGEMIEGTLQFKKAGMERVESEVQSGGAQEHAHAH